MGKKKFIEKKHSATYRLVFKDFSSGGASGEGTDRVFVRVDSGDTHVPGFDPDTEDDSGDDEVVVEEVARGSSDDARQAMLELGFPDDGYNYLQHLREVGPSGRIGAFVPNDRARLDSLRPDVKAFDASRVQVSSTVEESSSNALSISGGAHRIRGSMSKVIDPDVTALLDKEDDASLVSGDELEDDFVAIANECAEDLSAEGPEGCDLEEDDYKNSNVESEFDGNDEDGDIEDSYDDGVMQHEHERQTRFLDEQFELLALREYDDDEIGELDDGDMSARGHAHISKFNNVMADFLINSSFSQDKYHTPVEAKGSQEDRVGHQELTQSIDQAKESGSLYMPGVDKSSILASAVLDESVSSDGEKELVLESDSDSEQGRWDCESIVTTYSNLDNHPGTICSFSRVSSKSTRPNEDNVIHLRGKQQLPVDYLPKRGRPQGGGRIKSPNEGKTVNAVKRTVETKEEKKARKAAIKEEKRTARALKKGMKLMYKDETQRAQRTAAFGGPATVHL